jgi:hypothetical protein
MGWADWMWLGGIWIWFIGLNLLWFLGDSASRRSRWAWVWGTPALLGLTGWMIGCSIDGGGCCRLWDLVGGGVGVSAGFILGHVMADGCATSGR